MLLLLLLRMLLVSVLLAGEVIEELVQGFHSRSARAIVVLLFSQVICGNRCGGKRWCVFLPLVNRVCWRCQWCWLPE